MSSTRATPGIFLNTIASLPGAMMVTLNTANGQCPMVEQAKVLGSDAVASAQFGADVGLSGDRAVVSSSFPAGNGLGAAYVYGFNGSGWTEEAILRAADEIGGDRFGVSAAFDGNVVVVGAYLEDLQNELGTSAPQDTGAAYVFRYNGSSWVQEAKLTASDATQNDQFGFAVAVDGDVILVSADSRQAGRGAAYVFRYDGSSWVEEDLLAASDGAMADGFSQALSLDGDVAVIGAPHCDDNGLTNAGAAYVFRYDGTTWVEEVKLIATDAAASDAFGIQVATRGGVAAIGAFNDDDVAINAGSVYVFRQTGGAWVQETKILPPAKSPPDASKGDGFGSHVALDDNLLAIGASEDNDLGDIEAGSAYLYRYRNGAWILDCTLTASDGTTNDRFGRSIATSGGTVLVGSLLDDNQGSAYFFKAIDSDSDGLSYADEAALGETGCPDPFDADSDDDTLSDGSEVLVMNSNPCSTDSDGDGIGDSTDPLPTQPGVTQAYLELLVRSEGQAILGLPLSSFNGPNANANKGRRNSLSNRAAGAANLIAAGDYASALNELASLLEKIDGQPTPPDWMPPSPARDVLAAEVELFMALVEVMIP